MKKLHTLFLLTLLLTACAESSDNLSFKGSDFGFSYPASYELKKAATMFVFQNSEGESVLTMHRYLAGDADEVIAQMQAVGQNCKLDGGGANYGGYKSYEVKSAGGTCSLEGSLVTNKEGVMVLIIENSDSVNELQKVLRASFTFFED
jgi:hypothetical protein